MRPEVRPARGVVGEVVAAGDLVEERTGLHVAGQDVMGRDEVVVVAVRQRPNDRVRLSAPRASEVFAGQQPRRPRGDRPVLAANLGGRIGLGVERLQVAGRTGEEDDDERFRLLGRATSVGAGKARKAEPEQPGITDLKHLAARNADGVLVSDDQARSSERGEAGALAG